MPTFPTDEWFQAFIVAVVVSLLVALTVGTALATALLARPGLSYTQAPLARRLESGYSALLPRLVGRVGVALPVAIVLIAAGAASDTYAVLLLVLVVVKKRYLAAIPVIPQPRVGGVAYNGQQPATRVVALGPLDLEYIRTQHRQDIAGVGAGDVVGDFDHPNARQRSHVRSLAPARWRC